MTKLNFGKNGKHVLLLLGPVDRVGQHGVQIIT